ncbi:hypothetical protein O3M35_000853 [Rhynocoris fuscipes]|uniref:Uncharacterized protein n=1 Tax=Rhynocoris fuscipes TaxID=488301 RepID=A0AAW1DNT5_9HEMI
MKLVCLIIACVLHNTYAARDLKGLSKKELAELEDKVLEECRVKNNVDKSVIENIDKQEGKEGPIPDTKEFKCMMGCFAEELSYIKDNKPQWETMHEIHQVEYEDPKDLEKALKILEVCKTVVPEKDEDKCNLGYEMAKCYLTEAQKVGLELI